MNTGSISLINYQSCCNINSKNKPKPKSNGNKGVNAHLQNTEQHNNKKKKKYNHKTSWGKQKNQKKLVGHINGCENT